MRRSDRILPIALFTLTFLLWPDARNYASPVEDLQKIGSTTLRWMLITVYDSSLYSPNGKYRGIEPGLALKIEYHRNIKRQRLVDTTRKQWMELELYHPDVSESWLEKLQSMWPDIRRGDSITLFVEPDLTASFFHNSMPLGQLQDESFTRNFLAIWLAENSSFPELRNELIGIQ